MGLGTKVYFGDKPEVLRYPSRSLFGVEPIEIGKDCTPAGTGSCQTLFCVIGVQKQLVSTGIRITVVKAFDMTTVLELSILALRSNLPETSPGLTVGYWLGAEVLWRPRRRDRHSILTFPCNIIVFNFYKAGVTHAVL
jgi:hypothetical protein